MRMELNYMLLRNILITAERTARTFYSTPLGPSTALSHSQVCMSEHPSYLPAVRTQHRNLRNIQVENV